MGSWAYLLIAFNLLHPIMSFKSSNLSFSRVAEGNANSALLFLKKAVPGMNQMIAKLWETIDIKNASLSTCLATKLNLTLIKGARVCPLFPVEAFAFLNKIPTFSNFLRAIESQTNLKGSIKVEARAKHYAILAHKEENILMIQSIIEEKGNLITNQLESSCIWRINHNAHLWGIKIRLPYQVLENEWIYNLFNGEDCLPSLNLKEVVWVSDDCIIIFYKSIPLSLVHLIAKTKGFIWINALIKAKCSIWMPTKPYHLLVECPLCGVNHPASLTCTMEIIWKQGEDVISKLFKDEQ